jgi:hypothetical protein
MEDRASRPEATAVRLWAVALLTFKEAIRRRIFLIVVLFAVALVGSAPFLPAMDGAQKLRLIEVWSVRAAFVFSLILAVFLAGFSIPGDVEARRIYTLVAKPVHKVTIFCGKFLGFVLMIAAFLGSTGLLTVAYLRIVAMASSDFPPLRAEPRFGPGAVSVTDPANFNAERHLYRVFGGSPHAIVWTFEGLDKSGFEPAVKAKLKVDLGRRGKPFELTGRIRLEARNPSNGQTTAVEEEVTTNKILHWSFPREFIDDEGRLEVRLTSTDRDLVVVAKGDEAVKRPLTSRALVLYGRSELFELTFFKGLVLVLFQAMIILAVTLSVSAFLTAPVSIMMGIMLFLLGWFWGFLQESVQDVDRDLEHFRQMEEHEKEEAGHAGHGHGRSQLIAPPWMMEASSRVSKAVLFLVPSFDQFNMSDYLLQDYAVMGRDVAGGFLAMLPRVAVLLLIGVIAMALRDFAA